MRGGAFRLSSSHSIAEASAAEIPSDSRSLRNSARSFSLMHHPVAHPRRLRLVDLEFSKRRVLGCVVRIRHRRRRDTFGEALQRREEEHYDGRGQQSGDIAEFVGQQAARSFRQRIDERHDRGGPASIAVDRP